MKYDKFPDITGQRFGKIVVLNSKMPGRKALIKCDCGIEKLVSCYDVFNSKIKSCGSKSCVGRSKNLINKKFSLLTVIGLSDDNDKNITNRCSQWKCKCECGTILIVPSNQLNSGRTKSCGCAKSKWISAKNSLPIKLVAEKQLFGSYKKSAKDRQLIWDLTKEDFVSFLYNECFYCGSPPIGTITKYKVNNTDIHYFNGIDRINNNIGYVKDNCVTCCKFCNHAKNNMTQEFFINLAKKIASKFN